MNISLENIDKVTALLTAKVEKADYQEKVEKALRTRRQKAEIPGFRKGMVPMSLMKKMYGHTVLAEEVNRCLSEGINNFLKDNKVEIIGDPFPDDERQPEVDFDTMEEFVFTYDLALAPQVDVELSKDYIVPCYNIAISDDQLEAQVNAYRQQYGRYEQVTAYEENDMLKGLLVELDDRGAPLEKGVRVEGAIMMPSYMKNDEQKALFAGVKVGDSIVFHPHTAWDGNESELASLLKIKKEKAGQMRSNFSFTVGEITRYLSGEINQELFDHVFGQGVVTTQAGFRARIKEQMVAQFQPQSDYKFVIDMRQAMFDKKGLVEVSIPFIKHVLLDLSKDKDGQEVEEGVDHALRELTWQYFRGKLADKYDIKVEDDEALGMAKSDIRAQFAHFGMVNIAEDMIVRYAQETLEKNKYDYYFRVVEHKLIPFFKEAVTVENKTVSIEEFNALFQK
ncbi:MAG: trigger factor [Prevotellaceae bacterium]|jgi:trigger factor|nr:trigger factor [Prevotellaceae bacterium]